MEWFSELMNYRASLGGYLFPEVVYFALIALICLSILLTSAKILFGKTKKVSKLKHIKTRASTNIEGHMVQSFCAECQWEGPLPKFNRRCPRCGSSNFSE